MSFFLFCSTSHNAQLNKVGLALWSMGGHRERYLLIVWWAAIYFCISKVLWWHYDKCPLLRRSGTRSGPGPPPPRRGWGRGPSWPRPQPRAESPGSRHPGRGQWPLGEPGQGWSVSEKLRECILSHSFTAMLHNCSLFLSEQWMASRLVLTAALLAVRQRPAPSSVNLMSPSLPVIPSPHLLVLHVTIRVANTGGLQSVSLDPREVETRSEPGNINPPAVIKRLTVLFLSQDLKRFRGIKDGMQHLKSPYL